MISIRCRKIITDSLIIVNNSLTIFQLNYKKINKSYNCKHENNIQKTFKRCNLVMHHNN